jgi:hypothetical protein
MLYLVEGERLARQERHGLCGLGPYKLIKQPTKLDVIMITFYDVEIGMMPSRVVVKVCEKV